MVSQANGDCDSIWFSSLSFISFTAHKKYNKDIVDIVVHVNGIISISDNEQEIAATKSTFSSLLKHFIN